MEVLEAELDLGAARRRRVLCLGCPSIARWLRERGACVEESSERSPLRAQHELLSTRAGPALDAIIQRVHPRDEGVVRELSYARCRGLCIHFWDPRELSRPGLLAMVARLAMDFERITPCHEWSLIVASRVKPEHATRTVGLLTPKADCVRLTDTTHRMTVEAGRGLTSPHAPLLVLHGGRDSVVRVV